MLYSDVDLSKTVEGKKQALPELADNTKTKISYLILSFNPYSEGIKPLTFKLPQEWYSRNADERYNITFYDFWSVYNNKEPSQLIK